MPASKTDKEFAAKHPIQVVDPLDDDRAENNDKWFRGETHPYDRPSHNFGRNQGEDETVYEGKRLRAFGRALADTGPETLKHAAVQVGAVGSLGGLMGGAKTAALGAGIGLATAAYAGAKEFKRSYKQERAMQDFRKEDEDFDDSDYISEEREQELLEISKKVLGNYVQRAIGQATDMSNIAGFVEPNNKLRARKLLKKVDRREKGVSLAFAKAAGTAKVNSKG